jgi:hemerythrin superfamily protein
MEHQMNALDFLKDQHDEVDDLFAKIEKTESRGERVALFRELADKLAAHAKIEEEIFYPAIMAKQTEELILESVEEHLAIKRVLADMLQLSVASDEFDAKLSVMKEQVTHHAREEEEGELFPKVKRLLDKDELEGMAGELAARFAALLETAPRKNVPRETDRAARIH